MRKRAPCAILYSVVVCSFLLCGKGARPWERISREKTAVRVSTKERTDCIAHDLLIEPGSGMRRDAKYADKHDDVFVATDTTVDEWFEFWIENIVGDLAPNTLRNYRERYFRNIQPVIGKMLIANVKPMHCKKVFIQMDADYAGSTIRQAYITMGTMFKAAKMNDAPHGWRSFFKARSRCG